MTARQFRTDREAPPVDPWAGYDPTMELPTARPATPRNRQVFGRVYELITADPQDGPHPYVGQTIQTLHQRVHTSRNAHTSAASIAKDPWKARILPGKAGYRLLEIVYATGDKRTDERELDRAEAFWIDRLRTTHNDVRPVRPPLHEQPAKAKPNRPARRPSKAKRAARVRLLTFATLVALFLLFYGVRFARVPWDNPATPWMAVPIAAALTAWALYFGCRSAVRKIKRGW